MSSVGDDLCSYLLLIYHLRPRWGPCYGSGCVCCCCSPPSPRHSDSSPGWPTYHISCGAHCSTDHPPSEQSSLQELSFCHRPHRRNTENRECIIDGFNLTHSLKRILFLLFFTQINCNLLESLCHSYLEMEDLLVGPHDIVILAKSVSTLVTPCSKQPATLFKIIAPQNKIENGSSSCGTYLT